MCRGAILERKERIKERERLTRGVSVCREGVEEIEGERQGGWNERWVRRRLGGVDQGGYMGVVKKIEGMEVGKKVQYLEDAVKMLVQKVCHLKDGIGIDNSEYESSFDENKTHLMELNCTNMFHDTINETQNLPINDKSSNQPSSPLLLEENHLEGSTVLDSLKEEIKSKEPSNFSSAHYGFKIMKKLKQEKIMNEKHKKRISYLNQKIIQLLTELENAKKETLIIKRKPSSYFTLQNENIKLQSELELLKKDVAKKETEINFLKNQNSTLKSESQAYRKEGENMYSTIRTKNGEIADLILEVGNMKLKSEAEKIIQKCTEEEETVLKPLRQEALKQASNLSFGTTPRQQTPLSTSPSPSLSVIYHQPLKLPCLSFKALLEPEYSQGGPPHTYIPQPGPLSLPFLSTLSLLLDTCPSLSSSTTFAAYTYSFLGTYCLDREGPSDLNQKAYMMTLKKGLTPAILEKLPANTYFHKQQRIWFYKLIEDKTHQKLWLVSTVKRFLEQNSPNDEVLFFLHCRNRLLKGPSWLRASVFNEFIQTVEYQEIQKLIEEEFDDKFTDNAAQLKKKFKNACNYGVNKTRIDLYLALRVLLEFYTIEKGIFFKRLNHTFTGSTTINITHVPLNPTLCLKVLEENFKPLSRLTLFEILQEASTYTQLLSPNNLTLAPLESALTAEKGKGNENGKKQQFEGQLTFDGLVLAIEANGLMLHRLKFREVSLEKVLQQRKGCVDKFEIRKIMADKSRQKKIGQSSEQEKFNTKDDILTEDLIRSRASYRYDACMNKYNFLLKRVQDLFSEDKHLIRSLNLLINKEDTTLKGPNFQSSLTFSTFLDQSSQSNSSSTSTVPSLFSLLDPLLKVSTFLLTSQHSSLKESLAWGGDSSDHNIIRALNQTHAFIDSCEFVFHRIGKGTNNLKRNQQISASTKSCQKSKKRARNFLADYSEYRQTFPSAVRRDPDYEIRSLMARKIQKTFRMYLQQKDKKQAENRKKQELQSKEPEEPERYRCLPVLNYP